MTRSAPDVFVVFGVPKRKRPTYLLWKERKVPAFVLEVASPGTWREDEGRKARLYERLGVREYWQYDPTGEYLGVHLKGRRLVAGRYEPQPVAESPDGSALLRSETLGLDLWVKGEEMYFVDPTSGRRLLNHAEQDAARRAAETRAEAAETRAEAAESRAEREHAARLAAEAELAALHALLDEKRG